MDMWTFTLLLEDIAPSMEIIETRVFLDRKNAGRAGLLKEISKFKSLMEAQNWLNMVPVDDLLSGVSDDWGIDNPQIEKIRDIYARSWLAIASKLGVEPTSLSVIVLRDAKSGDVIFRLDQNDA
jgi:hypothetical protein